MNWPPSMRSFDMARLGELALTATAAVLCATVLWIYLSRTVLSEPPPNFNITVQNAADAPGSGGTSGGAGGASQSGAKNSDASRSETSKLIHAAAEAVNGRNLFSPPKHEGFSGQIVGILGDQVMFSNHQMVGLGETAMGAKVVAIGPDWVRIEYKGKPRKLSLFGGHGPGGHAAPGGHGGGALEHARHSLTPAMMRQLRRRGRKARRGRRGGRKAESAWSTTDERSGG